MSRNIQINEAGVSLESFIKDNEALLSALAVIAALFVFSKDLSPSYAAGTILFFLTGGIVLLWLEIWFKFPEQVTWRLFLFRYVMLWSVIGIIYCWLYQYRAFWDIALFIPMTIIAYWFEADLVHQVLGIFPATRKFFGIGNRQKTKMQRWIIGISVLVGLFLAFYFGVMISTGTNLFLDILKLNFPKS